MTQTLTQTYSDALKLLSFNFKDQGNIHHVQFQISPQSLANLIQEGEVSTGKNPETLFNLLQKTSEAMLRHSHFLDGADKINGTEKYWFADGVLAQETNWKKGDRYGAETLFHENGQQKQIINWESNQKHGTEIFWHCNGEKKQETEWSANKRHGLETFSNGNGSLHQQISWENGQKNGLQLDYEGLSSQKATVFRNGIISQETEDPLKIKEWIEAQANKGLLLKFEFPIEFAGLGDGP